MAIKELSASQIFRCQILMSLRLMISKDWYVLCIPKVQGSFLHQFHLNFSRTNESNNPNLIDLAARSWAYIENNVWNNSTKPASIDSEGILPYYRLIIFGVYFKIMKSYYSNVTFLREPVLFWWWGLNMYFHFNFNEGTSTISNSEVALHVLRFRSPWHQCCDTSQWPWSPHAQFNQ